MHTWIFCRKIHAYRLLFQISYYHDSALHEYHLEHTIETLVIVPNMDRRSLNRIQTSLSRRGRRHVALLLAQLLLELGKLDVVEFLVGVEHLLHALDFLDIMPARISFFFYDLGGSV